MWTMAFVVIGMSLAVFVKFYSLYEVIAAAPATAKGKPTLTITLQSTSHSDEGNKLPAISLFNSDNTTPAEELREIADDIVMLLQRGDAFGSIEIEEFIAWLKGGETRQSSRLPVPYPISRGHELFVAQTDLQRDFLHPSWRNNHVAICKVTGRKNGKVLHIPWNTSAAQQFHTTPAWVRVGS